MLGRIHITTVYSSEVLLIRHDRGSDPRPVCDCSIQQATRRSGYTVCYRLGRTVAHRFQRLCAYIISGVPVLWMKHTHGHDSMSTQKAKTPQGSLKG